MFIMCTQGGRQETGRNHTSKRTSLTTAFWTHDTSHQETGPTLLDIIEPMHAGPWLQTEIQST